MVLVGTPIGNLGDCSPRAQDALANATVIACEDTRRTGALMQHLGLGRTELLVLNEHTEAERIEELLARLERGEQVVVVSDAGMPAISDPGALLVAAVSDAGYRVEVVPGPSAVLAGLVVSGLPTARFVFEGFLPRKGSARRQRIEELVHEQRTVVLLEAPHRIERTLRDLAAACGDDRRAAVARELTKLHEEVRRATLAELATWASDGVKGELVLVLDGAEPLAGPSDEQLLTAVHIELAGGASVRDASASIAQRFGIGRRRVYDLAVASTREQ